MSMPVAVAKTVPDVRSALENRPKQAGIDLRQGLYGSVELPPGGPAVTT